jgi:hypothetical protein
VRHVDDQFEVVFFGRLGEHDSRFDESIADWKVEIGTPHTFQRCADIAQREQVAEHNFGTEIAQALGASVIVPDHRPDL